MSLSFVIRDLGFSDRDSFIYISCLKFELAPASRIADDIGENRTTIYHALLDLCSRGIANKIKRNNTLYFSVISPNQLTTLFEQRVDMLKKSIPELYALSQEHMLKSHIRFYEGTESVKSMYMDKLMHGKEFYGFIGMHGIHPRLKEFMYNEYLSKKLALGVKSHMILRDSKVNREFVSGNDQESRSTVLVDNPLLNLNCEIDIYGNNRVALITGSEQHVISGVILENSNIYDAMKSFFDILWQQYSV